MPHSKSSKRWLQEHFEDVYVKKAQAEGYRSRAVYKLQEINEREHLFKKGMTVVDLGAAPGGWSQYAAQFLSGQGQVFALDILSMEDVPGVQFIQGDFREDTVLQQLIDCAPSAGIDIVLSDMAPNMSGSTAVDIPRAMGLTELAFDFAQQTLKPGGVLLLKIFHGEGFDEFVREIRQCFKRVVIRKPKASRPRSRETYLVAKDYNL